SGGRSRPARTIASAWTGFRLERGRTASPVRPWRRGVPPSPVVATRVARWADSTKPPRVTWTSTGASMRRGVAGAWAVICPRVPAPFGSLGGRGGLLGGLGGGLARGARGLLRGGGGALGRGPGAAGTL